MAKIEVKSSQPNVTSVWVDVDNVTDEQLQDILTRFDSLLRTEKKPSVAVARAYLYAIHLCPQANPSDVWQHIIYRHLITRGWNDQQWKRVSGYALEYVWEEVYNPRLEQYQIRLRNPSRAEMPGILQQLGLAGRVKNQKIDLLLEGHHCGRWHIFGGVHSKASLAERIQDDVPASVALMERGYTSIVLTMDSKSFPPPHGDGVNRGELRINDTGDRRERPKRAYIEEDGQFDALFSFNLRTPPSPEVTKSGKRIFALGIQEPQPDVLVCFLDEAWRIWKDRNL